MLRVRAPLNIRGFIVVAQLLEMETRQKIQHYDYTFVVCCVTLGCQKLEEAFCLFFGELGIKVEVKIIGLSLKGNENNVHGTSLFCGKM